MTIAQKAFQFSLQLMKAAVALGNGNWGTPVTFPSARTLNLNIKYIQDTAEGNSIYTALASQIVAVEWSVDGCNMDQDLIAIVSGETSNVASSGTATEILTQTFANDLMPYFGLVAQAWGQNGDDMCILIPYTKVMTGFSWKFDFGKFVTPNFKGTAINEPTLNYMLNLKNHKTKLTAAQLLFPPSFP